MKIMLFLDYIKRSDFIKNTLKLSSSNFIMCFLPLIVTPILSRIYTPADFGDWGIFSSTTTILSVFLLCGYEYAIVKSDKEEEIPHICLCCLCAGIIITIICILFFILGNWYNVVYCKTFPNIGLLFIYIPVTILLTISQSLSNRMRLYGVMSVANMITGGSQALMRICFGSLVVLSGGLIYGTVVANIIALLYILYALRNKVKTILQSQYNMYSLKSVAIKYKKFPLFDAPSSLLAFAAFNLPIIILSLYYDKSEIGCYSMVIQLLLMPISLIGASMGRVYFQEITGCSAVELRNKTIKIVSVCIALSIFPLLFFSLGGYHILSLFLGEKWISAGHFALLLSIWATPTIITQPVLYIYRVTENQNRLFVYNALYFVLGIGFLLIMCLFSQIIIHTILIYAIICALVKFLLAYDILRLANIKLFQLNKVCLLLLFASLIIYFISVSFFLYYE